MKLFSSSFPRDIRKKTASQIAINIGVVICTEQYLSSKNVIVARFDNVDSLQFVSIFFETAPDIMIFLCSIHLNYASVFNGNV